MTSNQKTKLQDMLAFIKQPSTRFLNGIMLENIIENVGSVGGIVFTSFLLYLGLLEDQIAIILSIVGLSQLVQIFSTIIYSHFQNKKRIIFILRFIRSFTLVILPLLPLAFPRSNIFSLIVLFTFIRFVALNLIGGGFVEWNDSFIEENKKGIYYGTRNVLGNLVFILLSFITGKLLDSFDSSTGLFLGIFIFMLIMNIVQWLILRKIPYIPPEKFQSIPLISKIMLPLKDKGFTNYILFTVLWTLSLSLGKPLLNMYAIKYMNYSYSFLALTAGFTAFVKLFAGIYNGKQIDRQGAKRVVIFTGIGFGLTTFSFVFLTPNLPQLYFIGFVLNGVFMIGFNVSKFRLEMQLSKGPNMNAYVSMNVFFSGLTVFLCIYFSSFFIKKLSSITLQLYTIPINSYQILLFLSGVFHILAIIFFINTVAKKVQ